jgi:outer membrane protein TolC
MNLKRQSRLVHGFRRGADLRAARAQEDAADAGLVDARFQVALTTKQQYFAALRRQSWSGCATPACGAPRSS